MNAQGVVPAPRSRARRVPSHEFNSDSVPLPSHLTHIGPQTARTMAAATAPGWMNDDLADEWIDEPAPNEMPASTLLDSPNTSGPMMRAPSGSSGTSGGTFVVRENAPGNKNILGRAPGLRAAQFSVFSPMKLQRMFQPPTPPNQLQPQQPAAPDTPMPAPFRGAQRPGSRLSSGTTQVESQSDSEDYRDLGEISLSELDFHDEDQAEYQEDDLVDEFSEHGSFIDHDRLRETTPSPEPAPLDTLSPRSDEILETDIPDLGHFNGRKHGKAFEFTFNVPRDTPKHVHNQPTTPATDPRLRLFHLQYDTFTHEHLSNLVDAISGAGPGSAGESHPRSTKRIRLSPPEDTPIMRRRRGVREYVGQSKRLMQRIRDARLSIYALSTPAPPPPRSHPPILEEDEEEEELDTELSGSADEVDEQPNGDVSVSDSDQRSSSAIRKDANFLMARIKSDWTKERQVTGPRASPAPASPAKRSLHQCDGATGEKEHTGPAQPVILRRPVVKATPRKLLRRLSAAEEVDREIAQESLSLLEQHDQLLAATSLSQTQPARAIFAQPLPSATTFTSTLRQPPSSTLAVARSAAVESSARVQGMLHPSGSNRNVDDLNRFVSSSTAAGSAVSSTLSCVKHAGPPTVTRIAPSDVPALPERVGGMVFDKRAAKWVKDDITQASDDPFEDIESLRSSSSSTCDDGTAARASGDFSDTDLGPLEDELDTQEGRDVRYVRASRHHFDDEDDSSDDGRDAVPVNVMTGIPDSSLDESDWDLANPTETYPVTELITRRPKPFDAKSPMPQKPQSTYITKKPVLAQPLPTSGTVSNGNSPGHPTASAMNTITFSAAAGESTPQHANQISAVPSRMQVQATPARQTSTSPMPRSALKGMSAGRTPMPQRQRSVSFSDGKMEGKIRGLRSDESGTAAEDDSREEERQEEIGGSAKSSLPDATAPSISMRAQRITDMFHELEDSGWEIDTPSKCSIGRSKFGRSRSQSASSGTTTVSQSEPAPAAELSPARDFHRSSSHRPSLSASSIPARNLNQTFLTECSFGVAHDRLVTVITDVEPYEPHWENLRSINLSKKNVESLARLKEFLPKIEEVRLDGNRIEWLTGAPDTLMHVSARDNWITSLTAFTHLPRLQFLDLTKNQLGSLHQLSCLSALKELIVEGNEVESITGLENMRALEKLNLRGNKLRNLDLRECNWPVLESLDLSNNGIRSIRNLDFLGASLVSLNLDGNKLQTFGVPRLEKLRVLRVSDNALKVIELRGMPALRTLYADGNALRPGCIRDLSHLRRLENLSLRNQGNNECSVLVDREIRDVKRLYLSANPLSTNFITEACFSVVYLELAACRLSSLPESFSTLVPNVRVLNLNYNFLSDLSPLSGLSRMRKLTVIGSRLQSVRNVVRVLRGMPDLEMGDFRMNPFSLGWYLPLLVRDVPGALQPSEGASRKVGMGNTWEELDRKFRGDLPDGSYIGRLAYRGLVMEACQGINDIDGVAVRDEERAKAKQLLEGVARAQGRQVEV